MGIGSWLRQRRKAPGTHQGCPDVPVFEQLEPRLLLSSAPLNSLLVPPLTDQQDQQVVEEDLNYQQPITEQIEVVEETPTPDSKTPAVPAETVPNERCPQEEVC